MPELNETPTDSRRDPLRRLSSLASLQALNPFARRRSHHIDSSTATSSTSNLSLSSTIVNNAPQTHQMSASSFSRLRPSEDEITALPIPPVPSSIASRRSSYICLPDDPIGGMPRSRTLSNLPLPTRARRNTGMAGSKSHSRLPSAVLPPSRIPTPPISSRRHSNVRLTPVIPKQPFGLRNRMKRSDTEPLLPVNLAHQGSNVGRTTAFKENISLSPVKPLPAMFDNKDFYGSTLPSRAYASRHGWMDTGDGTEPLLQADLGSSLPLSHYRQHSLANLAFSQSSPAYRSARERQPTPGASQPEPMQRWNSQPILSTVTNRRNCRHGEIKERRLLSEVSIPPPPPPKTPLTAEALVSGKAAKRLSTSADHLRQASEQSPSLSNLLAQPSAAIEAQQQLPSTPHLTGQAITTREPPAYWCGRFSALNDRYRSEELAAHLHHHSPKHHSDKMHSPEANTRRMRRALEHLYERCVTREAREGFVVFQLQFAALQNVPELGRPLQLNVPERRIVLGCRESVGVGDGDGDGDGDEDDEDAVGDGGGGMRLLRERRERTFMDRLLGRGRKSLM
ncbi:hypothetical protein LTR36_000508 [Oleoguttula mirabilis]|uniref:Uncharacterized protein n=1 Tax=Oleoguttula mirabilis TaxID=1507867 RepID=A0AAV9JQ48_9PEZI|nr:hypothetical protein LTR36_000508 [Oleoguttula mirabilis]